MPKIRRKPPPLHHVVVDTNILWDKDKKLPVAQAFDAFWKKNGPLIPMTLNVPEVVLGELQFQQTTSALKALAVIDETFAELSGISSATYSHKCNEATLKAQVKAKLDRWLRSHAGVLLATPVESINWGELIHAAIWRKPPFSFDPKDAKNEKGFRDALVLETLAARATSTASDEMTIFVCNDYLLRTSAERRLKASQKFLAFESTADFESYIKLTQQQLTNEFVKAIQSHARAKFYTKDDPNCICNKHSLASRIQSDFEADLVLQDIAPRGLGLVARAAAASGVAAVPVDQRFWVRTTQFSKLEGAREFHWVSRIDVVRVFEVNRTQGLLATVTTLSKHLLVLGVDIKWKANVKSDGRFHDIELGSLEKADVRTLDASEENLKEWRLT